MSKNTATVFLIDISPSTGEEVSVTDVAHPGQMRKTTALALQLEYVKEKIGEKLWRGLKTDRAAVFAFGSEKTNNTLAGVQEGYENIDEVVPMGPATTAHYDKLRKLKPSSVEGDALSAVVVGITEVDQEVGSKNKWTKEIILVTDGMSATNWDGAEQIRDKLNESKIELTVVGVNFDDDALEYVEENKPEDKRFNETMWSNLLEGLKQATAFGNAVRALDYVRAPRPQKTNGTASKTVLSLGDLDEHADTSISIDVDVYKAVQMERPKSQKKMSTISGKTSRQIIDPARGKKRKRTDEAAERDRSHSTWNASMGASQAFAFSQTQSLMQNGHSEAREQLENDKSGLTFGVNSERKYFYVPNKAAPKPLEGNGVRAVRSAAQAREEERARDESSTDSEAEEGAEKPREEVPSDVEQVKAYKYGATRVPMSGVDESMLVLDAKPGIEILGFVSRSEVRREHHLGLAWWVFGQPASGKGQITMSILVHSLYEKDFVAIARYVATTRNAAPKMVALYPRMQPEDEIEVGIERWEGLVMLQLPFLDDVRNYSFNSLKRLVTKSGKEITEHKNLPTEDMNESMRNFVDSTNLDRAGGGEDDEHPEPWYRTTEVCNPAVHVVKRAVLYRTANPLDPDLPPVHSEIQKYFKSPEEVVENSKDALHELAEQFEIRKVPPKPKKKKAGVGTTVAPIEEQKAAAEYDQLINGIDDADPQMHDWGSGNRLGGEENGDGDDMVVDSGPAPALVGITPQRCFVGIDDPIGDFERVVRQRSEVSVEAVREITGVAHELFKNTVGSSAFPRVLKCLQLARARAVKMECYIEWNDFISQFKGVVLSRPHKSLWKLIQKEKLGLINYVEANSPPGTQDLFSVEEAEKFLA